MHFTTNNGQPISNNQDSLTAGCRGPILLQDYQLIEKLANQNRERIPERIVHAKGSGAYGKLSINHDISQYSQAEIFSRVGEKIDCFVRFSTVAGERGAADAERDVRGFAIKIYTSEGNWDIVGNNTPVFFIRDPYKFPDFVHSQKRNPKTNLRSNTAQWDFFSLSPESLHQVTILMSDRGIPTGYRHMNGYGSHTYSFINKNREQFWVKFHFLTLQGHQFWTNEEASQIIACNRESSQQDLYEAIQRKDFPKWRFCVQIMTEAAAKNFRWNPFDLTKVWSHSSFPLIDVGVLELNRNPENYFAEVEQAAFSPSNIINGISFSPDKVLQARLFAYPDAHRYRIGTHFSMLPINRPHIPVSNYYLDGAMRSDIPQSQHYYSPSNLGGFAEAQFSELPIELSGNGDRYSTSMEDNTTQVRHLFQLFNTDQKKRLFNNIASSMQGVPEDIINKQLGLFREVDPEYALGVSDALKSFN